MLNIVLVNSDLYGNNVRVVDSNAGSAQIFNGYIPAKGEQPLQCRPNDSDEGYIVTFQDGGPGIGRSFLKEGQRIDL